MRPAASFLVILGLALFLSGCPKTSAPTTQKGAGGLPIQQWDSSEHVIPWDIPKELEYPGWQRRYEGNNRIYLAAGTPETIAKFYLEKLPNSVQEEVNAKKHIKVHNDEIEVDIVSGGDQTEITIIPLKLGVAEK